MGDDRTLSIRTATPDDLDLITEIEKTCFPPLEAAGREAFRDRLQYYSNHFHILFLNGKAVSFTDGFVTDDRDLTDEMYENASLHNENGKWQMIFGVNTLPEYRGNGYAGMLLKEMIRIAREERRLGLVLTCKEALIPFYARFGFVNEGVSSSVHGNCRWFQMRYTFSQSL